MAENNLSFKTKSHDQYDVKTLSKWDVIKTTKWLSSIGYSDCIKCFQEHNINGRALLMLDENDMKEVIKHNVGQRKNVYHIIRIMQIRYNRYMNKKNSRNFFTSASEEDDNSGSSGDESDKNLNNSHLSRKDYFTSEKIKNISYDDNANLLSTPNLNTSSQNTTIHRHLINESEFESKSDVFTDTQINNSGNSVNSERFRAFSEEKEDVPNFCENCLKKFDNSPYSNFSNMNKKLDRPIRCYKGEKRKTLVSMIYLFFIGMWTSFILTVVHDRVPDMQKYPPLPDLILDNVPQISWAFFASEAIGIALLLILTIILTFHKYRIIIFRRVCSLSGTIFFLRSITMLITSLSVPGLHIQCASERYGSLPNKIQGAWNILTGAGLYVSGVRTCGDYMFSGHTVFLTLTTHFISEYTPRSMYWLHTGTWIMNVFGLFFILGSHEHYSIDVFVGFYITSRLFLYYHSLANNKALFQRDQKRVKIWFPLLSYFESNIHSIVPNEFQYPPNIFYCTYKYVKNKARHLRKTITRARSDNQPVEKTHIN